MKSIPLSLLLAIFPLSSFASPNTSQDVIQAVMTHFGMKIDPRNESELNLSGTTSAHLPCSVEITYYPEWSGHAANLVLRGSSQISAHAGSSATIAYLVGKEFADTETSTIQSLILNQESITVSSVLASDAVKDEGVQMMASRTKQKAVFTFIKGKQSRILLMDDVSTANQTECFFN